jgi:hypothetical protein
VTAWQLAAAFAATLAVFLLFAVWPFKPSKEG